MFVFNGMAQTITIEDAAVVNGVVSFTIADLWRAWCDWAVLGDNLKYPPALESVMVPLNATEFVGPYVFLRNDLGWVGIPPAVNPCTIVINGSFFGKDPNVPVMQNLAAQATDLVVNRSVLTNTVVANGSAVPFTLQQIAQAVWGYTQ